MRRKDREITDPAFIEELISKTQIMRVAFYDDGEIYIVPLNYGYVLNGGKYTFYFHGAKGGRKYELSKNSPSVGFELDSDYELITGNIACDCTSTYKSIIGTGTISLTDDIEEKKTALNAVMKQTTGRDSWEYSEDWLNAVAIFRLDVEKLSCKSH